MTPVLTANWGDERAWKLTNYERRGGYDALRAALQMEPAEVVALVKESGLRGRGGAGFPTGMKWSFIPQDNPKPKYLVVNADESEPGTCKDIPLMMASPAHSGRGRDHLRVRDPRQHGVHLRPRRGAARGTPPAAGGPGGVLRRLRRQEHPRHRL